MDMLDRLFGMFRRGVEMLLDCWPVKLVFAAISSVFCFLFGGSEAILVVVLIFVGFDTLSKWAAITKRYLIDQGGKESEINIFNVFCGFWFAWQPGYLSSSAMRRCWGDKLFVYLIFIICAGLMGKFPEITLFGLPVNRAISGGIYSIIFLTELLSISENLEEYGYKRLGKLKEFFCILATRITGGGYSVTVSNMPGRMPGQMPGPARPGGAPRDNPGEGD